MGEDGQNRGFEESYSRIDRTKITLTLHEKIIVVFVLASIFGAIAASFYLRTQDKVGIDGIKTYYYANEDLSKLNSATVEELKSISGIGETKAMAIVDYRNALGGFTSYAQLLEVDGISDKLADRIMEFYYGDGYNPYRDGEAVIDEEDSK